jgi:hypothetical protein
MLPEIASHQIPTKSRAASIRKKRNTDRFRLLLCHIKALAAESRIALHTSCRAAATISLNEEPAVIDSPEDLAAYVTQIVRKGVEN